MFKQLKQYRRINRAIAENEKVLLDNLSKTLGVRCKIDRLKRIYCVINPIVDNIDNDMYTNRLVYEYDAQGRIVYTTYVRNYIMRRLSAAASVLNNNVMFDMFNNIIVTRIDDDENYLVVFENLMLPTMRKYVKIASIVVASLTVVAAITTIVLKIVL